MAFLGERRAMARLVARCSKRPVDGEAWEEFIRRFHPTIRSCVSQVLSYKSGNGTGHKMECADTVIPELVEEVYRRLTENRSQSLKSVRLRRADSMHSYLALISISVVQDYVRESSARMKAS
jgi:hypothetical protein